MNGPRELCRRLNRDSPAAADLTSASEWLAQELDAVGEPDDFLQTWHAGARVGPVEPEARRQTLWIHAPMQLLDGIWLARVAQPANGHEACVSPLLALYVRTVGLDDPGRSPPLRFRASLQLAGITLPSLGSPEFFVHQAFPEFALALPAAALVLWHWPRRYFAELLGFTLAHAHREPAWWDVLPAADHREYDRALAVSALAAWAPAPPAADRVRRGWALYRQLHQRLTGVGAAPGTVGEGLGTAVARLLMQRSRHGRGYHGRVRLAGRSLDQWLDEAAVDPRPLLRELRRSPWVEPACPSASRLLRAMDFGGPMFGVFDARERRLLCDWIGAADTARELPEVGLATDDTLFEAEPDAQSVAPSRRRPGPSDSRQLYQALLQAESPAECPAAAWSWVDRILARTRRLRWLRRGLKRGFRYSPEAFSDYVDRLHRHEIDRYRPFRTPPRLSRDYCRWAILQLAPAILVDGAWLARVGTAAEGLDQTSRDLLSIYADELGNGECDQHHGNVYRRLLSSEGLEIADFRSQAFVEDARLLDAAFDIPVYLLAIGLAGERYFPERLGLNLAIELSGLGAAYLWVVDLLNYHGIDATIIRLHQSIDNLASGHAAKARDCILRYLGRLPVEVRQRPWRRIWNGYLSLETVGIGLAAGFFRRYLLERCGRSGV